jgi:nicotinate-nucleotide--dimethylbenzimidazole phosphoribosyltransferase
MRLIDAVQGIAAPDPDAMTDARFLQDRLTKPRGSLGVLEELAVRLCGLAGTCPPPIPSRGVVAIFAGDHGVHAQGVSPWPQAVTAQMVANFLAGGAVANAFAREVGAQVTVVDVGVAGHLPEHPALRRAKVRLGTRDLSVEPALTRSEAVAAIEAGLDVAAELIESGHDVLITGDMGIANTTASACLIAAFTGAPAETVTGRGTGIDDETLARKSAVVAAALAMHDLDAADPVGVLAAVGGLEHAALTGFILGGAALRVPVLLDGVNACAAALAAVVLAPDAVGAMFAGHRSTEPGATVALHHLGLVPLLDLGLRLGEGTGALLALPIVAAAARALNEVATLESAGVSAAGDDEPDDRSDDDEPGSDGPGESGRELDDESDEEPAGGAGRDRSGDPVENRGAEDPGGDD